MKTVRVFGKDMDKTDGNLINTPSVEMTLSDKQKQELGKLIVKAFSCRLTNQEN